MSKRNLEITRRSIEAYCRGDWDESLSYIDPEAEWLFETALDVPNRSLGHAEIRALWAGIAEPFDDFTSELKELIDAGDRVFVRQWFAGRGRGSEIQVEGDFFGVMTVSGDKITRIAYYSTRSEALEAAGLPA